MEFVEVLDVSELPSDRMVKVSIADQEILVANLDGTYYAISNKCTHLGGSLAKGDLEGSTVTCPRHGAQFDLKTGGAVRNAKIAILKMPVKDLDSYQVKVEGGKILVGVPG